MKLFASETTKIKPSKIANIMHTEIYIDSQGIRSQSTVVLWIDVDDDVWDWSGSLYQVIPVYV